jgi:hypothetical protein
LRIKITQISKNSIKIPISQYIANCKENVSVKAVKIGEKMVSANPLAAEHIPIATPS